MGMEASALTATVAAVRSNGHEFSSAIFDVASEGRNPNPARESALRNRGATSTGQEPRASRCQAAFLLCSRRGPRDVYGHDDAQWSDVWREAACASDSHECPRRARVQLCTAGRGSAAFRCSAAPASPVHTLTSTAEVDDGRHRTHQRPRPRRWQRPHAAQF